MRQHRKSSSASTPLVDPERAGNVGDDGSDAAPRLRTGSRLRLASLSVTSGCQTDLLPDADDCTNGASSSPSSCSAVGGDSRLSGRQRRMLACLSLGGLLAGCLIAVMIPFFPHEAQRRGLPQTYSGAVFSCFALTQLLAFPVMGRLAPRVGVTLLYNVGLATAGVATVVFGVLPWIGDSTVFIAGCLACRALEAIGTAAMYTAARAIIINQFPHSTNTAMSVSETLTGVGLSLGPALGGILYQLAGYGAPFYVLGGVMLLASATNSWMMPTVDAEESAGPRTEEVRRRPGARLLRFFSALENWLCCAVVLVVAMYVTALDPNIEPYVRTALGLTPAQLGLFFLMSSSCYTVASLAWGRVSDRVSNTYILTAPCLLVGGLGILLMPPSPLLGLSPSRWLLGVGMVVREMTTGGAFIPIVSRMMSVCVAHGMENNLSTQAFVSAVFGATFSVGNVVGPTLGGYITDLYSFPVAATALALVGGLVAAACVAGALVNAQKASTV